MMQAAQRLSSSSSRRWTSMAFQRLVGGISEVSTAALRTTTSCPRTAFSTIVSRRFPSCHHHCWDGVICIRATATRNNNNGCGHQSRRAFSSSDNNDPSAAQDLLQRLQQSSSGDDADKTLSSVVHSQPPETLLALAQELLHQHRQPQLTAALLERALKQWQENETLASQSDSDSSLPVISAQAHTALGICRYQLGEVKAAQQSLEVALELRRKVLGTDHPETAASLVHLGMLYQSTQNYNDAIKVLQEALQLQYKHIGGLAASGENDTQSNSSKPHPILAGSHNNLGSLYLQAATASATANDTSTPSKSSSNNNDAIHYLDQAIHHYEQALQIYLLLNQHAATAGTYHNLSMATHARARQQTMQETQQQTDATTTTTTTTPETTTTTQLYQQALDYAQKALELRQALATNVNDSGERNTETTEQPIIINPAEVAASHYALAQLWLEMPDPVAVAMKVTEADSSSDDDSENADGSDNSIGNDKWDKAVQHLIATRDLLQQQAAGNDNNPRPQNTPPLPAIHTSLGNVYGQRGQYDKALQEYNDALQVLQEQQTADEGSINNVGLIMDMAATHNNRGLMLFAMIMGNSSTDMANEAVEAHQQAIDVLKNEPSSDPLIARQLALAYGSQGNVYRAHRQWNQALQAYQEAHPHLLTSVMPMGATSGSANNDKTFQHPDVAANHNNLGLVYTALRQFEQAAQEYQRAAQQFSATLGPQHAHVAATHFNLGLTWVSVARSGGMLPAEADQILQRASSEFATAHGIWEHLLGPDHEQTQVAARYAQQPTASLEGGNDNETQ